MKTKIKDGNKYFEAGGKCLRVILEREPGSCSSGVIMRIEVEDDGNWFTKLDCDSHWLSELTEACNAAMEARKNMEIDWDGK